MDQTTDTTDLTEASFQAGTADRRQIGYLLSTGWVDKPTERDQRRLATSYEHFGQLLPILVYEQPGEAPFVIDGRKRLVAWFAALGPTTQVDIRLFTHRNFSPANAHLLRLGSRSLLNKLVVSIELCEWLAEIEPLAADNAEHRTLIELLASQYGSQGSLQLLQQCATLQTLPKTLQFQFTQRSVPLATMTALATLPPTLLSTLADQPWIDALSSSQWRQLVELLADLNARDNDTGDTEKTILGASNEKQLLVHLLAKRNQQSSRFAEISANRWKQLSAGKLWQLRQPQGSEQPKECALRFHSLVDLENALSSLQRQLRDGQLRDFLKGI